MRQKVVKPATSIWTAKGRVNRYPPSRMTAPARPRPLASSTPNRPMAFSVVIGVVMKSSMISAFALLGSSGFS